MFAFIFLQKAKAEAAAHGSGVGHHGRAVAKGRAIQLTGVGGRSAGPEAIAVFGEGKMAAGGATSADAGQAKEASTQVDVLLLCWISHTLQRVRIRCSDHACSTHSMLTMCRFLFAFVGCQHFRTSQIVRAYPKHCFRVRYRVCAAPDVLQTLTATSASPASTSLESQYEAYTGHIKLGPACTCCVGSQCCRRERWYVMRAQGYVSLFAISRATSHGHLIIPNLVFLSYLRAPFFPG